MLKPALRGVPVFVLVSLLTLVQPCFAQDGPLLPGLEPSDPAPLPSTIEDAEVPSSTVEAPLPVDDGITPLDENGQPMNGPESDRPMRLPAPPPLPVTPRTPTHVDSSSDGPSLSLEEQTPAGKSADERLEPEPQKRNLWQRSTDALRDLRQPKIKADLDVERDAASQWQQLRQRELEQQRREQRQLQQRELQQRELQRRQFEQRQQQQRRRFLCREAGTPAPGCKVSSRSRRSDLPQLRALKPAPRPPPPGLRRQVVGSRHASIRRNRTIRHAARQSLRRREVASQRSRARPRTNHVRPGSDRSRKAGLGTG